MIGHVSGNPILREIGEIGEKMFKRSRFSQVVWLGICVFDLIGLAAPVQAQENVFDYRHFSMTLPEGWVKEDIPKGCERELIGSLKSQGIPGTSILIFCYEGGRYHYSGVRILGLKTIVSVFPKGQEMVNKKTQVKTDGGLVAVVEFWRGAAGAAGPVVFLQAPMGIIETEAGWILMLGFTPDPSGAQLGEAFLQMIRSAKYESGVPEAAGFISAP
jgi:hypothetical protein